MSYCRFVITIYRNWKPLYDNLNHTKILSENELIVISYITVKQKGTNTWSKSINQKKITLDKTEREIKNEQSTDKGNIRHIRHRAMTNKWQIRVITKLPNTEQSSKGKDKTHKSTNRQNQSTTGKLEKPQWPWLDTGISKQNVCWIRFYITPSWFWDEHNCSWMVCISWFT